LQKTIKIPLPDEGKGFLFSVNGNVFAWCCRVHLDTILIAWEE